MNDRVKIEQNNHIRVISHILFQKRTVIIFIAIFLNKTFSVIQKRCPYAINTL